MPHVVHNFLDTEEQRVALLEGLKTLGAGLTEEFTPQLNDLLTPSEQAAQKCLEAETFKDGSWYRPIHNIIVPLAMLAILKQEDAPRDLVYAAQLHDVGYSQIDVACTLSGKDFDRIDRRLAHMKVGAVMTRKVLEKLSEQDPGLSPERIERLCFLVETHDNPYIGIPLGTREQFLLRDADRSFVPSVVSWYKDLIAHAADVDFRKALTAAELRFSPHTFAEIRLAGFYYDAEECAEVISGSKAEYRSDLSCFNPGSLPEPQTTSIGEEITGFMLKARLEEAAAINRFFDVGDLLGLFAGSARAELDSLVKLAA